MLALGGGDDRDSISTILVSLWLDLCLTLYLHSDSINSTHTHNNIRLFDNCKSDKQFPNNLQRGAIGKRNTRRNGFPPPRGPSWKQCGVFVQTREHVRRHREQHLFYSIYPAAPSKYRFTAEEGQSSAPWGFYEPRLANTHKEPSCSRRTRAPAKIRERGASSWWAREGREGDSNLMSALAACVEKAGRQAVINGTLQSTRHSGAQRKQWWSIQELCWPSVGSWQSPPSPHSPSLGAARKLICHVTG